jgi:hypothetical protein
MWDMEDDDVVQEDPFKGTTPCNLTCHACSLASFENLKEKKRKDRKKGKP